MPHISQPMFSLEQAVVAYIGGASERLALRGISLELPAGSWTAVVGHNGSGKSTFAKVLAGLCPVTEGRFAVPEGRTVHMVLQHPDTQILGETVREELALHMTGSMAISGTAFDTLEARATDGFVCQIPPGAPRSRRERGRRSLDRGGGSRTTLAGAAPPVPVGRPVLPRLGASGTLRRQRRAVALQTSAAHVHREPGASLAPTRGPDDPAARGAGPEGATGLRDRVPTLPPAQRRRCREMGPDLARPMSPTQYLSPSGLRAIIRDPRAVRTWPDQHMPGFDETALPDADLDAVIAYLHAMAGTSGPQNRQVRVARNRPSCFNGAEAACSVSAQELSENKRIGIFGAADVGFSRRREYHMCSHSDLALRGRDMDAFSDVLLNRVQKVPGVVATVSVFVLADVQPALGLRRSDTP